MTHVNKTANTCIKLELGNVKDTALFPEGKATLPSV